MTGERLASRPTLSRFESAGGRHALYRMGCELARRVIGRRRRRLYEQARHITIDLEATEDPTHGAQEFSFFNGHSGNWCYLPLLSRS